MPVVGALLSREILNHLQDVITESALGATFNASAFWGSMVLILLIFYFIYRILTKVTTRLSNAVTRMAGERVVRHVKIEVMQKAQVLDLAAFDLPAFYEKLCRNGCEIYQKKINTDHKIGTRVRLCDASGAFFALGEVRDYENGTAIKGIKYFDV
jgi:hypothetical protein